ncbi:hypothetical protein [Pelosinus sp. UFO1]|uniref:hypothetical protein n=1 Tax=Pelosinus sp. UFO1 TaxID=484770 RepID=UPI0004D1089F|nr:hypothetical protein [Pelosinus sp. UFO1]AIF51258.1 Mu-like prophage FluMu protein gp41 [Pelosinus sp. UFO1]
MKLNKPITKNGVEIAELNFDFNKITGNQIIAAEKEARLLGDTTPDSCYSKTFQAIIAARAANESVIVDDILNLSGADFIQATTVAANFLFGWALPGAHQENS